jgi:hypothetical protein
MMIRRIDNFSGQVKAKVQEDPKMVLLQKISVPLIVQRVQRLIPSALEKMSSPYIIRPPPLWKVYQPRTLVWSVVCIHT